MLQAHARLFDVPIITTLPFVTGAVLDSVTVTGTRVAMSPVTIT